MVPVDLSNLGNLVKNDVVNPIQDRHFRGCRRLEGGEKRLPFSKICHTYPTIMKLGTVYFI